MPSLVNLGGGIDYFEFIRRRARSESFAAEIDDGGRGSVAVALGFRKVAPVLFFRMSLLSLRSLLISVSYFLNDGFPWLESKAR